MNHRLQNTELLQDLRKQSKSFIATLIVGVVVIYVLVCFGVSEYLQPKARTTCASFGLDWAAAQKAFSQGDTWLDGDRDGQACNGITRPIKLHI